MWAYRQTERLRRLRALAISARDQDRHRADVIRLFDGMQWARAKRMLKAMSAPPLEINRIKAAP